MNHNSGGGSSNNNRNNKHSHNQQLQPVSRIRSPKELARASKVRLGFAQFESARISLMAAYLFGRARTSSHLRHLRNTKVVVVVFVAVASKRLERLKLNELALERSAQTRRQQRLQLFGFCSTFH